MLQPVPSLAEKATRSLVFGGLFVCMHYAGYLNVRMYVCMYSRV